MATGLLNRLPTVLKDLDKNGDQQLQAAEIPDEYRVPLMRHLDRDQDGTLSTDELDGLRRWLEQHAANKKES